MNCLLLGGNLYIEKKWICADMRIENGSVAEIGTDLQKNYPDLPCFDLQNKYVFPGFIDVHVHFREPGFSVKETIESGSRAAAHGGYTHVCTMPNLNPVPDTVEHLSLQQEIIKASACVHVYPYGSITMEEKGEKL